MAANPTRLTLFALWGSVILPGCGALFASDPAMPLPDVPHWIAHRGDSAVVPENTLAAVRAAFERTPAPTCVEIDVQLSRDGVLVVVHDDELDRTTGDPRLVSASDWSEIASLRAGFTEKFGEQYADEPLPRLEQVLDLAAEFEGHIMIEVKPREAGAAVGRLLRARNELSQHTVASFEAAALAAAEDEAPGVRKLYLVSQPVQADVALAEELGASILGCNWEHAHASIVATAHDAGLVVWAYTVNDAKAARELKRAGVDGLISDRITELRAELDGK